MWWSHDDPVSLCHYLTEGPHYLTSGFLLCLPTRSRGPQQSLFPVHSPSSFKREFSKTPSLTQSPSCLRISEGCPRSQCQSPSPWRWRSCLIGICSGLARSLPLWGWLQTHQTSCSSLNFLIFFSLWTPGLCKYNFLYPVHSYLPVKIKDSV